MISGNDRLLVDRIYEAAVVPELWPAVFDDLGGVAGCDKTGMFVMDVGRRQPVKGGVFNERGKDAAKICFDEGWISRSTQAAKIISISDPRFFGDLEIFTREEIDNDPYYQEFLRPHGLSWGAGTFIDGPTHDKIIVTTHRAYEHGPLESAQIGALTALRPHLSRAAFLSARLELERMDAATQALARLGLPAGCLNRRGRLVLANGPFESLIPDTFADRQDRLRIAERRSDGRLGELISEAGAGASGGGTMLVRSEDGKARFIVHLLPIARSSRSIFTEIDWLVVALPVNGRRGIRSGVLEGLFDLTSSEARIAREIAAGADLFQVASVTGYTRETVRSYLKNVFLKTCVNRQSELLNLLSLISMDREPE